MTSAANRWLILLAAWLGADGLASADVVVFTNRTPQPVVATIMPTRGRSFEVNLASGEVRPVFDDSRLRVAFTDRGERVSYELDANAAYFFGRDRSGRVNLQKIGLGGTPATMAGRRLPGDARTTAPGVIPVKLLVDEEETTRQEVWERRLRGRVAKASDILYRHAGVRIKTVAVGTWRSDNQKRGFVQSLQEFEQAVDPGPARLAIGFTSQFETPRGRTHLGGTRGPLRRHLLVREWSRVVSEPEKLELLVHELGHFLGATHSPQRDSVMRPVLGDRLSRFADWEIRFDAANALVMSMVGEEVRRRGVYQFSRLSPGTLRRLEQVYSAMAGGVPKDKSTQQLRQMASRRSEASTRVQQVRAVVEAVTAAATVNRRLPDGERIDGDALTEHYVRVAATAAQALPGDQAAEAFLLWVALAAGDADAVLRGLQRNDLRSVESRPRRAARRAVLGAPTIAGRRDLAKHFLVSAGITAGVGAETADTLGYAKEAVDAQGKSGFSFVDLAANRAGIRFAEQVLAGRLRLHTLARYFRVSDYMAPTDGLREGMSSREVVRDYGGQGDDRFEAVIKEIDDRIDALPPYRKASPVER